MSMCIPDRTNKLTGLETKDKNMGIATAVFSILAINFFGGQTANFLTLAAGVVITALILFRCNRPRLSAGFLWLAVFVSLALTHRVRPPQTGQDESEWIESIRSQPATLRGQGACYILALPQPEKPNQKLVSKLEGTPNE